MKKEAILPILLAPSLFLILLTIIPTATALQLNCLESNATLSTDTDEVIKGSSEVINTLGIGLVRADETVAINRITARLLVNARKVSLTGNISKEFDLFSDTYTATRKDTNSSNPDLQTIQIDSSTDEAELNEVANIGSFKVFLSSKTDNSAEIVVGTQDISLAGTDDVFQAVTVDSQPFIIELFSATDGEALIRVHKCSSGNIEATADPVEPEINQTTPDTNQSSNQTLPDLNQTNQSSQEPNITTNISQTNASTNLPQTEESTIGKTLLLWIFLPILLLSLLVIIAIAIILMVRRRTKQQDSPVALSKIP